MEDTHVTEITSLLGPDTEFDGKLTFLGTVRLDGRFRGEINTPDTLIIGEGALVEAKVSARILIVNGGLLKGEVTAGDLVEIHSPGKIEGEINSPALVIDKGAVFSGISKMPDSTGGDAAETGSPESSVD